MNDPIASVSILLGYYDVDWIYVEVDVPEHTDLKYGYQN
jgi:hypothetical protein